MESKRTVQVPDYARDRLNKVRGHLNAAERKIENDPNRGIWSARQAKAQLAEVWIWLNEGTEFPFAERYLHRTVAQERVDAFDVENLLRDALDAIAKAWWAAFQPCNPHVWWEHPTAENVKHLKDSAPAEVSSALGSCLGSLETLIRERNGISTREVRNWRSAVGEMLPLFEAARALVEQLAGPQTA